MGMRITLPAVTLLVALAACGDDTVVRDTQAANAYDGPMQVDQDFGDRASVVERSGAAGLALECAGEPYAGGSGNYDTGPESVQGSGEGALEDHLEANGFLHLPRSGYVVERTTDERVLFSYDVAEQTRVALIAADGVSDLEDDEGWGIESWAQCDPSELPEAVTDELGLQIWQDPTGDRAPLTVIQSYAGPEHCDWDDITFLRVGPEGEHDEFLRDTTGELGDYLATTFADDVALPAAATDTGYSRDGRRLWVTDRAAYLVAIDDADDVERWPASTEPIGCA